MTYDQVVLLSIPVIIGVGAIAAVRLSLWLYPLAYTSNEPAKAAEILDFARFPLEDPEQNVRSRISRVGLRRPLTVTAPGYVMAARRDDDDNVIREKLPTS